MIAKRMMIELIFIGGVLTERELVYTGNDEKEVAALIDKDQNELLQYMLTGDDKGAQAFCFCGFMFKKKNLLSARLYEPEF